MSIYYKQIPIHSITCWCVSLKSIRWGTRPSNTDKSYRDWRRHRSCASTRCVSWASSRLASKPDKLDTGAKYRQSVDTKCQMSKRLGTTFFPLIWLWMFQNSSPVLYALVPHVTNKIDLEKKRADKSHNSLNRKNNKQSGYRKILITITRFHI